MNFANELMVAASGQLRKTEIIMLDSFFGLDIYLEY